MKTKEQKVAWAVTIIFITLLFANAIASSVNQWQASISNESGVKANAPLMVLSGDKPTSPTVETINWGSLYPDSSRTYTISIYNDHPENTMELYFTTSNWNPKEAQNYITIKWDLEEATKLSPKNLIRVTLILTISEDVKDITDFSFDITITGIEA